MPPLPNTPFRPLHRLFGLALLALGLLSSPAWVAADDEDARLQRLRQEIQSLRQSLNSDRAQRKSLTARLRDSERRIGKTAALLRELKRQIRRQQRDLAGLEKQQKALRLGLSRHRLALARQLRAAYAGGRQEYLKILLNQQDPAAVARTLTYYDYYNRARLRRIQQIDSNLSELRSVAEEIREKTARLQHDRREQAEEKRRLEATRDERAMLLAGLQQEMQDKDRRLSRLLEDERRLQRIIERIAETPLELPLTAEADRPFGQLRGKLAWPSGGQLHSRFGRPRNAGKLRWQGVSIRAPEGSEVRAVSHGRVAFSDWLRGFGLLIIIDHGDGYMSLYGGNQSLYKEVGDWVEAREVIAAVGNSGGSSRSALYFEIRHNGKPVNPLKWCRGKPKRLATR